MSFEEEDFHKVVNNLWDAYEKRLAYRSKVRRAMEDKRKVILHGELAWEIEGNRYAMMLRDGSILEVHSVGEAEEI